MRHNRDNREGKGRMERIENSHLQSVRFGDRVSLLTYEQYQFLLESWFREITERQYKGTFEEYLNKLKGGTK